MSLAFSTTALALNPLLLSLAVLAFFAYGLAIPCLFRVRECGRKAKCWVFLAIACGSALIHVRGLSAMPIDAVPARAAAGIILYGIALCLFCWAAKATIVEKLAPAYSELQSKNVLSAGPYHYMRHPLYVSYSLTWLAGTIAVSSLSVLCSAGIMIALYSAAAIQEERDLLSGPLRINYLGYKNRVPALPVLWRLWRPASAAQAARRPTA